MLTFDLITRQEERPLTPNITALSSASRHAGKEPQSMAAPYSITWPQHNAPKWISDWSAQQC